jgi:AraC-like DNA-binding protein
MLARPPIFIIAIRATLLITYANGHVAAAFPDPSQDHSSEPQVIRYMQPFTHSPTSHSPTSYATIRANLLEPILEAIRAQGHDPAGLLRDHALPQAPIDPYQLIPLGKYVALFEQAALLLRDPFLGLRLGQSFRPELLGPLGFIFQASANLRQALLQLSAYVSVWQSATRVELIAGDTTADYIYQIADPSLRPRRQDAEYSMASICSLIRNFLGDQWAPLEVHFEHGETPTRRAYTQALHAPVFFSQNVNRLIMRAGDLERAGISSDRSMMPFMERHLRDLARESREPESFARQVNYVIARRLGSGPLSLPSIAQELGLSARSFQRRLAEERTSFRSLVRDQRRTLAESLIKDRSATVTAVAHTVGYAETAVLSRAFKVWTGASPRAFIRRERHAAGAR